MAFCRLVFPFLVLSVLGSTFAQVPVYIWGDLDGKSTKANPLTTLSEAEFKGVLKRELVHDPFTVIFIDETLSVEDLSKRDSDGETSFPYLHANIGKAVYLPAVDNSMTVLNGMADPEKVDHVKLTENGLSAEIEPDSGKFLFIILKDAREGESRSELLRRHNDFMEKMFGELQGQYKELVAIYTAEYPSWVIPEAHMRARRQAESAAITTTDYVMDGLRLYAKNIIVADNNENSILSGYTGSESTFDETSMTTKMTFSNNVLTLNFTQKAGYWFFETVTIQQSSPRELIRELVPTSEVYAFVGFSYRCGQNISFTTINETEQFTLTFRDSKVQPFFKQTNSSDTPVFGDSINCVGFFSVPIWAGLFVVFILLAITFYGIMMMMDIRTMDRFDDPKGKTITINAGE